MMRLSHQKFVVVLALVITKSAFGQEPIRFARTPDISPDGKQVAFSYLGDIWIVDSSGGTARPVTMHEAHEINPIFSPDGKRLAFSSNRHGSYDVFVVPIQGGSPTRLTFDSATDLVNSWSPEGKQILFASTRSTAYPQNLELYTVPSEGGRVRRLGVSEGKEGVFSPKGDQVAYVRGPGTWYRKGYRGSSNDDIWICNSDGSHHQQVTTFNGQDNSPMWSPDGRFLYYVSELFGAQANIVRQELGVKGPPQQITFHKEDSVRRARLSGNGEWIVYECGADLWIMGTREGALPRKLMIQVYADDKSNTERTETFTRDASEFSVSYDEKHVAFAVHGQLFMMPIAGGKALRLTESKAFDHGIAWAPDSKEIIFASDRNGYDDLYSIEPDDKDNPELTKAHKFKIKQLTNTPEPEVGASFSPDGKRVAFLRGGKLWSMNPDGTNQKVIVEDIEVFDYDWSPDSKWLVYARLDGSFASELFIIPSEGAPGGRGKNITRYATYNGGVTWSEKGNKIAFISQRHNQESMYVLSLQKPAAEGAPENKDIDWDDIHLRVEQPSQQPAEEGAISPDGKKVAFRSTAQNEDDLWVASTGGGQLTRVTTGNLRPEQIQWSRKEKDLVFFRDGDGCLRKVKTEIGEPTVISFKAKMTIRRDEEFDEMFEQSWRALSEHFYDAKFHGVDWQAIREKYRPLVRDVAMKEDLYVLISLMMGELNASHLGISGFGTKPEETTADLGLLFDDAFPGPLIKVVEVLKRGPADKRGLNIQPGDLIRSIDGIELTEKSNLSKLLNDKIGETVVLEVTSDPKAVATDPKAWRRVEIEGTRRDRISNLMYDRWVEHNAKRVAQLSQGKLGYIHIPSMDEAGLDKFLRALYSDNFDKEAIVLDVRFNSGGFTHDQVLNYLGAHQHTFFRQRNGGEGLVLRSPDRKWTRPLVLLINNRSYSDAEIFPSAFRTLGLGKLVGQPTGGYVIGTSSTRLIDGSLFRVPRTGVYTIKGVDMEKEGVAPDILVEQNPDQSNHGEDSQLDKAVEVLIQETVAWKKTHPDLNHRLDDEKPATTASVPLPLAPGK